MSVVVVFGIVISLGLLYYVAFAAEGKLLRCLYRSGSRCLVGLNFVALPTRGTATLNARSTVTNFCD